MVILISFNVRPWIIPYLHRYVCYNIIILGLKSMGTSINLSKTKITLANLHLLVCRFVLRQLWWALVLTFCTSIFWFSGIPVNKSLYTISYMLITSASAGMTFCALYLLVSFKSLVLSFEVIPINVSCFTIFTMLFVYGDIVTLAGFPSEIWSFLFRFIYHNKSRNFTLNLRF